jgi:hypothetical protein
MMMMMMKVKVKKMASVDYHLFPGILVQGSEQLFIGLTFAPFLEEPSARARNNERESEPWLTTRRVARGEGYLINTERDAMSAAAFSDGSVTVKNGHLRDGHVVSKRPTGRESGKREV